jgi:hypothetical protein
MSIEILTIIATLRPIFLLSSWCDLLHFYICIVCCNHNPVISSFMMYNQVCNYSNTTGATSGAGIRSMIIPLVSSSFSQCLA